MRNSRTERPRKTKIGTEIPHVTRDSDTTFKVKRSKVKVTSPFAHPAVLARQAAAAVGVRTCWAWETGYVAVGGRRGVWHSVTAARLQLIS